MKQTTWLSLLLTAVMLLTCVSPAFADDTGLHSIVTETYPFYTGKTLDSILDQEFPLYFLDGVDDLPFVEIHDWAELLYFINTDLLSDTGYGLKIEYKGDIVTLERENEYTLDFDFGNRKLVFEDYDAFLHKSSDSTLIDLVSESSTDEDGNALLIWRNKADSFDRYGDVMTVDLGEYGIPMIVQDESYFIPLQTLNDFTLLPALTSVVFNGEALFLANDDTFYDYRAGVYTETAELYYEAPVGERSDTLAEYSYNELCLVLDTFYGLKQVHDIDSFRKLFLP